MDTRTLILGTAGHIDHGKTALVRALTGTDTDRLPEEKVRGITIDLGFAHLDLDTPDGPVRLGVVDVPGHERFIRNMLAGAAGVDLALLVVAADDSVMPQTREHLAILGFLGVRTGVVALTKCDRAEPEWLALVEEDVRTLVAGSALANAEIVRTSAVAGTGLDELRGALSRAIAAHPREDAACPFRMAIDRSFVKEGLGTVVTGTIGSGGVALGDTLAWHPQRPGPPATVAVRGIQSHGVAAERAEAGSRAALVLGGVHHEDVARGHELATPGYLEASSWLTVRVRVMPESPWPIRHRARIRLHLGTAEVPARVALLEGTQVDPGQEAVAQLVTARPVTAVSGQPFVLRAESPLMTLGGGRVLEPTARRRRRRPQDRLVPPAESDAARVLAAVERRGARDYAALDLAREAGVAPDVAEALAAALVADGAIVELAVPPQRTVRMARTTLEGLEERVARAVAAAHAAAPLEARVARSAVRQRLGSCDERVVEGVIDRLIESGTLVGDERDVADARFKPKLTDRQRALAAALAEAFEGSAFGPPDAARIARESGAGERDLKPAIEICVSRGDLVHIGGGQFLHRRWESELRERMRAALSGGEGLTMSELKDLLETTRKFAVPIGEYLDRIGLTRRVGDRRVLRQGSA